MRNRYVLLADLFAFLMAACAAFGVRFDWYFFQHRPEFASFALVGMPVKATVFYAFGMYGRFWRYATIDDMVALAIASTVASVAMAVFVSAELLAGYIGEFSRAVFVADWLFTLSAVGAVRLSVRVIGESRSRLRLRPARGADRRVLVVGAGDAGAIVTREMQRNPQLRMTPVGFLDDDAVKIDKKIYGVPVVGRIAELPDAVEKLAVDEVVIAMPKAGGKALRSVAEDCRTVGVGSRIIPGVFELLGGDVSVSRLRDVDITDLLRRDPVVGDPDCSRFVEGRTVLVTGAGGSIGFELCRQIAHGRPRQLVLLGHGENSIFEARERLREMFPGVPLKAVIADVRNRVRLSRVFGDIRPQIVVHAAAHKHVPLMEENPEEAISNNVLGTQNVVEAALHTGVTRFVLISSDKAVSPSSIMGASKRVAEAIVRAAARRAGRPYVVVRFGNVLGSRGSVVPYFKNQIERGRPLCVTHPEMKRFFMTIPEAVHLVLQAAARGNADELFVLKMGEPLPIVQLAEDLIRLSGLSTEEVPIVFTGLRPGEKLEESLWEEGTIIENTDHPDILMLLETHAPPPDRLADLIEILAKATVNGDTGTIHAALGELVPTYSRGSELPVSDARK